MLGNAPFYNRTIRKMVVAFGSVFNDIYLVRYSNTDNLPKETFKVPLSYGPKEKYLALLTSDSDLTKSIAVKVPRMSFELVSMNYDVSRKLPSTRQNFSANTSSSINTQYVPVPYTYTFTLSLYVRNTDDGAQILEQILPSFTPDYNVRVKFISNMDAIHTVPIILDSVSTTTEYEGNFDGVRVITWDMSFSAKGYIWPQVKPAGLIRQANTNIFIDNDDDHFGFS